MGLVREYHWDKHELIDRWTADEDAEGVIDSRTIRTDEIITETDSHAMWLDGEDYGATGFYSNHMRFINFEYALEVVDSYGDFDDHELVQAGDEPRVWGKDGKYGPPENETWELTEAWLLNAGGALGVHRNYNPEPNTLYYKDGDELIGYEVDHYQIIDTNYGSIFEDWQFSGASVTRTAIMTLETMDIYRFQGKGPFIEELIAEKGAYPEDGEQDGYWWVKGEEYTLEPPELIHPEPVAEKEDDVDCFEFEITPRKTYNPGNYHARLRVSTRSDHKRRLFFASTRDDTEDWEYYDGDEWQDFPPDGVDEDTRVRYNVPADVDWDFGMYFWDAQTYHSFWGYGPAPRFRSIILVTETDKVYMLYIRGIPYRITNLQVTESSNGQVGSIAAQLVNEL